MQAEKMQQMYFLFVSWLFNFSMMKRFAVLFIIVVFVCSNSFAQKKDINAWKNENTLEQQFEVFKKNVNFWNGSYFMEPDQLAQFYEALTDSVMVLEKTVVVNSKQISSLQNELKTNSAQTEELQVKLDESIKHQNAITVFGMHIEKTTYAIILYSIIIGLLVITAVVFMLFKRSNSITVSSKKEYAELKEEFETHKKSALDRYTKMNMELHKTRLELNKK